MFVFSLRIFWEGEMLGCCVICLLCVSFFCISKAIAWCVKYCNVKYHYLLFVISHLYNLSRKIIGSLLRCNSFNNRSQTKHLLSYSWEEFDKCFDNTSNPLEILLDGPNLLWDESGRIIDSRTYCFSILKSWNV